MPILLSFQGRIPRKTFWLAYLALLVFNFIAYLFISGPVEGGVAAILDTIYFLWIPICIWIWLETQVKRWHDRGKSGWMVLINFIPIVGILWTLVELGFLQGTTGVNQYGDDPLQMITILICNNCDYKTIINDFKKSDCPICPKCGTILDESEGIYSSDN